MHYLVNVRFKIHLPVNVNLINEVAEKTKKGARKLQKIVSVFEMFIVNILLLLFGIKGSYMQTP